MGEGKIPGDERGAETEGRAWLGDILNTTRQIRRLEGHFHKNILSFFFLSKLKRVFVAYTKLSSPHPQQQASTSRQV